MKSLKLKAKAWPPLIFGTVVFVGGAIAGVWGVYFSAALPEWVATELRGFGTLVALLGGLVLGVTLLENEDLPRGPPDEQDRPDAGGFG